MPQPRFATDPVPVLVIASTNPAKLSELHHLFDPLDLDLRPMPADLVIEETGGTYAANASLKATTVASRGISSWTAGLIAKSCKRDPPRASIGSKVPRTMRPKRRTLMVLAPPGLGDP